MPMFHGEHYIKTPWGLRILNMQNWGLHGKGTIAGRAASPLAAASWVAYFGFTVMAMGSAGHALSQAPQPRHFERSTTGHITSPRFSSLMAL